MNASAYIDNLVSAGRYTFSTDEAVAAIGAGPTAVRAQLRTLRAAGRIAQPFRSFHVVIPAEYRRLGCLPADQFVDDLMRWLGEPYYIGLLSAAERHGAAHQRPQALQVVLRHHRTPISCGEVRIQFISRQDLTSMPITTANTSRGIVRVATPEVTALELVGYPRQAGGLGNAASVLAELAPTIDASRLLECAHLSPVSWSQRLGYILEQLGIGQLEAPVAAFVHSASPHYTPLRRAAPTSGAPRDARWKLIVNSVVEPDL